MYPIVCGLDLWNHNPVPKTHLALFQKISHTDYTFVKILYKLYKVST